MEFIKNLSSNGLIFWIVWGIEAIFMSGWWLSELNYRRLRVNPSVYWGFAWLAISLLLFVSGMKTAGLVMAGIAALPLAIMAVFMIVIFVVNLFFGPIRWN